MEQSQWQLAGLGSFNSADTADMMLRNTTTGALELYDVNNNNFIAGFSIGRSVWNGRSRASVIFQATPARPT